MGAPQVIHCGSCQGPGAGLDLVNAGKSTGVLAYIFQAVLPTTSEPSFLAQN